MALISSPFITSKNGLCVVDFHSSSSFVTDLRCKKTRSKKIVSVVSTQQNKRNPSSYGSAKIGLTTTEKILARASEKGMVNPGENVWANADVLMLNDLTCPAVSDIFKREFGNNAKVWDREKVVVIPDHYIFTNDKRAHRNVDIAREFCIQQDIKFFYDIQDRSNFRANPDYKGAFGQFATGVGNTDAAFILGTGKILLKVPPTLRFVLDGEMPNYLLAKDLILNIIGEISMSGATYKAMEFVGTTIESLTMEERITLCNMVVEAGGKNGIIAADNTTYKYLEDKTCTPYEPVFSDEKARFLAQYRFDVSKLEPLVAKPHSPDKRALARECNNVKIDRVYIGSCTGGKTQDFMAAAKVFLAAGKRVKVPTFLAPATQKVWMDLYTLEVAGSGGKTCSEIFEEAGCDTPTSPSCAACMGGPRDTYGRLNEPQVCVSTTNRNFPGRMGHIEGQVYLASPYTAAASALTGFVTDPRNFLF
ncbi:3-isopropylmalate dehydratase large subunit, chloroplastic isoform X2 [Arachis hypogaea]|uniref:3-isopropylmalate dehydratase large subunit, chloroplastic isoform X2 n=1 Tax=Arachis hypogaea TaxID=3818 RepID=UPI000DED0913|nr:3-isopropylmalate dehydratase large subunit, chloroplastic isoform X2 [Arachis hypogaea]